MLFCWGTLWIFHPATFCWKNGIKINFINNAGIGEDTYFLFDIINSGRKIFVIPESFF